MKRLLTLLVFTSIFSLGGVNYIYSQDKNIEKEIVAEHSEAVHDEIEHAASEHEGGMEPLLFIIIALIIGAATRHFLRKSPLPYTVMLLLTGIGMGVAVRLGYFEGGLESISRAIEWAGNIDPHVILFVFLPTLIFEAAFAMDVHTFKKTLTNAVILAVPGIILAMLLTAALAIGLDELGMGLSGWGWPIALMFGAVISATDPVAVVSLLKDLGVNKKLGTLIEGESLLNDGTAIVIFMVFFLGITGAAIEGSPIVEFGRVALGGTLIGLIIAGVTIAWVKRVFNDALVEITVIIAAAYLTFFVAEHFLHVSGVLGLVALGLAMAGVGKTRISPEVGHFLHEFWELAAFIANTLIFIIVGVVVAQRTVFTGMDFLILGIIYIGITVIRALVLLVLFPFMRKIGYGLPVKDAYVLWYGALRGAIGLALALIVAGEEKIDADIRNQFLFHTAGIVTLTLLINATTIKFLVNRLGLTKIPAVKALMMSNAFQHLTNDTENALELMKSDRFMSGANWNSVREYLPQPKAPEISEEELAQMDTMAETRRRILEKEKKSYWHQFQDGLLGPVAVSRLSDGVNEVLDAGGSMPLSERAYLEQLWGTPKFLNKLASIPVFGRFAKGSLSDRLAMSYDIARGFVVAQEEVVKLVKSLADLPAGQAGSGNDQSNGDDSEIVSIIREEIDKNRIRGLNFLKNVRETHPEIAAAIETKQAIRSVLNHERNTIKTLLNDGRIEHDEADKMLINVEERMKMLMDSPPSIQLPEPIELLKEVPWLKSLKSETFNKVVDLVEDRSYTPGKKLVEQGGPGDGLFIISRGTVKVTVGDYVIDILGPGSMIGEMAVLTGGKRTATVTAETPVTALWMKSSGMQGVMKGSKELEDRLWDTAGKRFAENLLGRSEPYSQWRQIQFRRWLSQGEVISLGQDEILKLDDKVGVLISGEAFCPEAQSKTISAPAVLDKAEFTLSSDARVFVRSTREA
ncbi:cation:proton antiporter [bacterium AH-315-M05]|nr:cation:proton antiporter [bacterium AH-315-M05]